MKTLNLYFKTILFSILLSFAACSDDDNDDQVTPTPTPNDTPIEGSIVGSWKTGSADDLGDLAANNNSLDLTITETNTYTFIYNQKSGGTVTYEGTVVRSESQHKHTNGAGIWDITLHVSSINGVPRSGGWKGIYSFDGENRLLFNIEPTAQGWVSWPTASAGLGSGQSSTSSIYKFNRQ